MSTRQIDLLSNANRADDAAQVRQETDEFMDEVAVRSPKNAQLYLVRAQWHRDQGEHGKALLDFANAIALQPENAEVYLQRGKLYEQQKKYANALADYETAVKIAPDDSRIQLEHAKLLKLQLSPREAIAAFSRLIKAYPTSSTYYRYRGAIHRDLDQYEEALPDLDKAIELLSADGNP